jgi:TonB family protein
LPLSDKSRRRPLQIPNLTTNLVRIYRIAFRPSIHREARQVASRIMTTNRPIWRRPIWLHHSQCFPTCSRVESSTVEARSHRRESQFLPIQSLAMPSARRKHTCTVVLELIVTRDGLPEDIKVVRSVGPALDNKAIEAVRKWKFAPATKNGKPVTVQIRVEVKFALY